MVELYNNEPNSLEIPEIFQIKDLIQVEEMIDILDKWDYQANNSDLLFTSGDFNANVADNEISILEIVAKCLAVFNDTFPSNNPFSREMNRKLNIVFDYPQTEDLNIIKESNALREIRQSKYLRYFVVEIISIAEGVDFRKNDHLRNLIPSIFKNVPKFIPSKLLNMIDILIKDMRRKYTYRPQEGSRSFLKDYNPTFHYEDYALINVNLLWSLYNYSQKENQKDKPDRFLIKIMKRYDVSVSNYKVITVKPESIKLDPSQYKPLVSRKLLNYNRLENRMGVEECNKFTKLYKKYIRALQSCLSFTNCASRLTRVDKLYQKQFIFTMKDKQSKQSPKNQAIRHFVFNRDGQKCIYCGTKQELEVDQFIPRSLGGTSDKDNLYTSCQSCNRKFGDNVDAKLKSATKTSINNLLRHVTNRSSGKINHSSFVKSISTYLKHSNFDPDYKKYVKKTLQAMPEVDELLIKEETDATQNRISGEDYIHAHLSKGTGICPLVINGQAGMGKTVAMTQFALQYVTTLNFNIDNNQFSELNNIPLPLFIKARRLNLEGNDIIDPKLIFESIPELARHISMPEFRELIGIWINTQEQHKSNAMYFLDGLDECISKVAAEKFIGMLTRPTTGDLIRQPNLILSTRPSRFNIVNSQLTKYGLLYLSNEAKYYSDDELSNHMPMMLCDSWGITREAGVELSKKFEEYKQTLIHPLFVGWFCFLILDDKLGEIENSSDNPNFSQNNLLRTIIDIGIESSLKRRESKYPTEFAKENDDNNFIEILESFIAVAFHFNIRDSREVWKKMKDLRIIGKDLERELKKSIEEDCGVLFLAGNAIDWTHPTIPEVVYADFYFDFDNVHPDGINDVVISFGPPRLKERVLDRLTQLFTEWNSPSITTEQAGIDVRYKYFSRYDFREYIRDYMINLDDFGNEISIIGLKDNDLSVICKNEQQPYYHIGELYLKSFNNHKRFPINIKFLDNDNKNQPKIIKKIYSYSQDPFGIDLIEPWSKENIVHPDFIIPEKINSNTKVVDCFRYYRNIVHDDIAVDLESRVLKIHKTAGDYSNIFNFDYANGMMEYHLSWRGVPDTWFEPVEESTNITIEFLDYIREEYVWTAYDKLFGKEISEACIDVLWDMLFDETVFEIYNNGEHIDSMEVNFLATLGKYSGLNDLIDTETGLASDSIFHTYDIDDAVIRGLFLIPFIHECENYLSDIKSDATEHFDEFIEKHRYWQPYEMVLSYLPNLMN